MRLFFALWPNNKVRHQVVENLTHFDITRAGGRSVARHNLHMTLHFVGNTDSEQAACLDRQAQQLHADAFTLKLDCNGYFKKPKVLWLGCQQTSKELHQLQHELGQLIASCSYQPELRPYQPHMTVARKVKQPPQLTPIKAVSWQVDRFVLVQSKSTPQGVCYEVIERYPLSWNNQLDRSENI